MCLVEVEGQRRLQPACTWKSEPGQVVRTDTDRIKRHQQLLLETDNAELRQRAEKAVQRAHADSGGVAACWDVLHASYLAALPRLPNGVARYHAGRSVDAAATVAGAPTPLRTPRRRQGCA